MSERRRFLKVVGGGFVLAAVGGGAWLGTRDPARARAPWAAAGTPTEPRRRALSYAILAPNPHNRQPWLVDLSVADTITLYRDPTRALPHTDPLDRQITVGLGCFLELLVQACAAEGLRAAVDLFPDGEPTPRLDARPVARIRLTPDSAVRTDRLFAHVLARRSTKTPYDTARPVSAAVLETLARASVVTRVGVTAAPDAVDALRRLTWEAMRLELATPATARESIALMRIGRAEIEANPDGITLAGPLVEALGATRLFDRAELHDPDSASAGRQRDAIKPAFDTAMAYLWLASSGNGRAAQIRAGRDFVRVGLQAAELGVAIHPLSQALQEFPEMAAMHAQLRQQLGIADHETPQMLVRLGYAEAPPPSPRWPLETRIRRVAA